jgi:hypothetical protein
MQAAVIRHYFWYYYYYCCCCYYYYEMMLLHIDWLGLFNNGTSTPGACGNADGWGTILQAKRLQGSIPDEVIGLFNWPNPSSCTTALGLTQSLTEMSTRNLPGGKGWLAPMTDNLTATCELTVYKMWEPWCLTTLWASMVCYKDSFTSFFFFSSIPRLCHTEWYMTLCSTDGKEHGRKQS